MTDLKTLRFVELEAGQIPAILEIEQEANGAPWSERSFLTELDNPDRIFLVAMLGGKVVGYGGVWLIVDEAHVTTLAVAAEHRGQEIGSRLMVELLVRAKSSHMVCSTLEVRASNAAAIHLYERLGYVQSARRKRYYPDNQEDAVVMWLFDLSSWEPPRR